MDKYKRYMGVIVFIIAVAAMIVATTMVLLPQYNTWVELRNKQENVAATLEQKRKTRDIIAKKIKELQKSVASSQKKIYTPMESKLGDDTLFFTLYSDVIDMVRANTIKIKTIDYKYNPKDDVFVEQDSKMYFVCDVNMEIVSNYVNLGKLIQDLYQYPYYIKINKIEVVPYQKDKTILLSSISLRLYAHTSPEDEIMSMDTDADTMEGASTPLPQ